MNRFELLNTIHIRNVTLQELVAFIAKTFAVNHKHNHNQEHGSTDPNKAFAKVLSKLTENDKKKLKNGKYKMTHAKLFVKNNNVLKAFHNEIDVMALDSAFLLHLMIFNDFHKNTRKMF